LERFAINIGASDERAQLASLRHKGYSTVPSLIPLGNETVRCVRDFMLKNKKIIDALIDNTIIDSAIKKRAISLWNKKIIGATLISRFLGGSEAGWGAMYS
jgi:hypothetical protein